MSHAQPRPKQTCFRSCCGRHKIPFFSTLSLHSCVPSHPPPPIGAWNAASTGCPLHSCAWSCCMSPFGDKHRWAVHSCPPTEKDENIWCWVDSSHIWFSFTKTAIDTFSRTKLSSLLPHCVCLGLQPPVPSSTLGINIYVFSQAVYSKKAHLAIHTIWVQKL